MRVYIVRHGQSTSNASEHHQGGEVDLSSLGIRQAKKIALRVSRLPIDIILSSDYTRALHTVEIIRTRTQKKLVITPLLREYRPPSEFEGKHIKSPDVVRVKKLIFKNRNNTKWHFSDEENFFDFIKRTRKLLRFLEERKEENILVIGHAFTTRMLIGVLLFDTLLTPDVYIKLRERMKLENTGISMCDYIEGKWRLITWNDYEHLG